MIEYERPVFLQGVFLCLFSLKKEIGIRPGLCYTVERRIQQGV